MGAEHRGGKRTRVSFRAFFFFVGVIFLSMLGRSLALSTLEKRALEEMAAAIPGLTTLQPNPWSPSDASLACTTPWFGIDCNGQIVTSIYLNNHGLTGFIPDSIGNLSSLEYFSVFNNSLSGTIPASFASISTLLSASFSGNKFSGSLPADLGVNQNLVGFYADTNNLTGTIPQSIGGPDLQLLYLGENRLTGTLPPSLRAATKLQELGISNNDLEGPLFPFPPTLLYVYMDVNRLNGSLPDLGALPSLIDFYASANQFSGTVASKIASNQLRFLSLSNNRLSGPLPLSLPPTLRELYIDRNEFNGTIPSTFFSAPLLESLSMNNNRLSGTIPPSIGGLQSIKYLYMGANLLNGPIPLSLSNLTALDEVSLGSGVYTGCFSKPQNLQSTRCYLQSPVCTCPEAQCGTPVCPRCLNSATLACPLLPNGAGCFSNLECLSSFCSPSMVCQDPPAPTTGPFSDGTAAPSLLPSTSTGASSADGGPSAGPIAGGIVGGIVGLAFIAAVVLFLIFRKRRQTSPSSPIYASAADLRPTTLVSLTSTATFKDEWIINLDDLSFKAELGSGSYGTVWRGLLRGVTDVAIKQANLAGRPAEMVSMFQKEAELMMTMRPHPNLIQTLGVAARGDNAYIIMELCPNGSVESLFGKGILTEELKLKVILGLAKAVDHLHANNIVHRDIAARNILLGTGDVPKLSDFGMSRTVQNASAQSATKTDVGPIRWMAPEAVESMTYSAASDIWTVGVTMIEIWTEKPPFDEQPNLLQVVKSLMDGVSPTIPSTVPQFLARIIQTCLQRSPSDRPSAREVCKALMEHIKG